LTDERVAVLRAVAKRIEPLPRPALIAIDGVTAAGKTRFADELATLVTGAVSRISVDDFHRPEAERRAHGDGPESYYRDAFDYDALRATLERVDTGAAIVDGVFLQRPELAELWSLTIFLAVDREVALERALARDAERMGGIEAARARYASRYVPGESLYLAEADPEGRAGIVVDNVDPASPRFVRGGRVW
jgi:uridine kinase